jgi:hypothetical protein
MLRTALMWIMRRLLCCLLFLLVLTNSGCGLSTRIITYDVSKVTPSSAVAPEKILNVRVLNDTRQQNSANGVLFLGDREVNDNEKRICVNSESGYETGSVPRQISALIAEHLRQRHAFKDVVYGDNNWADYQLAGNLSAFYAKQDYDYGAAVGSSFGMIGALATANNTEPTEIRIAITSLVLYDRMGGIVGRPNDIVFYAKTNEPSDAYCWEVYEAVNRYLFSVISRLATSVESLVSLSASGWNGQTTNDGWVY